MRGRWQELSAHPSCPVCSDVASILRIPPHALTSCDSMVGLGCLLPEGTIMATDNTPQVPAGCTGYLLTTPHRGVELTHGGFALTIKQCPVHGEAGSVPVTLTIIAAVLPLLGMVAWFTATALGTLTIV